jgi:hypothetical protein
MRQYQLNSTRSCVLRILFTFIDFSSQGRLVCRGCFDFEVGLVTCLGFAPKSKEEEAKWRNMLNEEKDGEEE